jgi:16S rRNA (adenine1518-N6/adenine1519-N6)-dimethyltransferase
VSQHIGPQALRPALPGRRGVIDAIVRAIDPRPGQPLVEIGPGLGA